MLNDKCVNSVLSKGEVIRGSGQEEAIVTVLVSLRGWS